MIIYPKETAWYNKVVKTYFAFIPMSLSDCEGYIWLERYYYYCDNRSYWRAPYTRYKDKEEFFREVVEKR